MFVMEGVSLSACAPCSHRGGEVEDEELEVASQDSLNLHDLSDMDMQLEGELAAQSRREEEQDETQTRTSLSFSAAPKALFPGAKPSPSHSHASAVKTQEEQHRKTDTLEKHLSFLQNSVSQALSFASGGEDEFGGLGASASASSENSLGLLPEEKLVECNSEDLLGLTLTFPAQFHAQSTFITSPLSLSDKENQQHLATVATPTPLDYNYNRRFSLPSSSALPALGDKTPVNANRNESGNSMPYRALALSSLPSPPPPSSTGAGVGGSMKKVSFKEQVEENSFVSPRNSNSSSEDRTVLDSVCSLPLPLSGYSGSAASDSRFTDVSNMSGLDESLSSNPDVAAKVSRLLDESRDLSGTVIHTKPFSISSSNDTDTPRAHCTSATQQQQASSPTPTSPLMSHSQDKSGIGSSVKRARSVIDKGGGDVSVSADSLPFCKNFSLGSIEMEMGGNNTCSAGGGGRNENSLIDHDQFRSPSQILNELEGMPSCKLPLCTYRYREAHGNVSATEDPSAVFSYKSEDISTLDKFFRGRQGQEQEQEQGQRLGLLSEPELRPTWEDSLGTEAMEVGVGVGGGLLDLDRAGEVAGLVVDGDVKVGGVPLSSEPGPGSGCASESESGSGSEASSVHAVSLANIKAVWPTVDSYMKAKHIARAFEKIALQHNNGDRKPSSPVASAVTGRKQSGGEMASDHLFPRRRDSLSLSLSSSSLATDASEFRDLSEYPNESHLSASASAAPLQLQQQEESVFLASNSFEDIADPYPFACPLPSLSFQDLSRISLSLAGSVSKAPGGYGYGSSTALARGVSFSTPKIKTPVSVSGESLVLETTSQLVGEPGPGGATLQTPGPDTPSLNTNTPHQKQLQMDKLELSGGSGRCSNVTTMSDHAYTRGEAEATCVQDGSLPTIVRSPIRMHAELALLSPSSEISPLPHAHEPSPPCSSQCQLQLQPRLQPAALTTAPLDFHVPPVLDFADILCGFSSSKEMKFINRRDTWGIVHLHLQLSKDEEEDYSKVFKVKSQLTCAPMAETPIEVTFSPQAVQFYGCKLVLECTRTSAGSVGDWAPARQCVELRGRSVKPRLDVYHQFKSVHSLECVVKEEDKQLDMELAVAWNCHMRVKLCAVVNCSLPSALKFTRLDEDSSCSSECVSFSTKEASTQTQSQTKDYKNYLTLSFLVTPELAHVSSVSGSLLLYAVPLTLSLHSQASKRVLVKELPVCVEVLKRRLLIEDSFHRVTLDSGCNWTCHIPLLNRSTTNPVSVQIQCDRSVLSASPAFFTLESLVEKRVRVTCVSPPALLSSRSHSLLTVLSDGVGQFECKVAIEPPLVTSSRSLTFNRKSLLLRAPEGVFSAAAVKVKETLKIKNCSNVALELSLFLDDATEFSISLAESQSESASNDVEDVICKAVHIAPNQVVPVSTNFRANDKNFHTSSLTVRVKSSQLKYVFPLYGYSGTCKLTAQLVHPAPAAPLLRGDREKYAEVLLHNCGSQEASFVVTAPADDVGVRVGAHPACGIVGINQQVLLTIAIAPQPNGSWSGTECLELVCGDVMLRKMYANCDRSRWNQLPPHVQSFVTAPAVDTVLMGAGTGFPPGSCGAKLQLSNNFLDEVNTLSVPLSVCSESEGETDDANDLPESDRSIVSSNVSTHSNSNSNCTMVDKGREGEAEGEGGIVVSKWTVTPQVLHLEASGRDSSKSFVIENESDRVSGETVHFKIFTSDAVHVHPSKGSIPPSCQAHVQVSRKSPSCRDVDVDVDGGSSDCILVKTSCGLKEVKIEFVEGGETRNERKQNQKSSSVDLEVSDKFVTRTRELLRFPDAKVGDSVSACLSLTNNLAQPIQWSLSSSAPAFVKNSHGDFFRTLYSVFRVQTCSGSGSGCGSGSSSGHLAHRGAGSELSVEFVPMDVGFYFQQWEFQINSTSQVLLKSLRVRFEGHAARTRKLLLVDSPHSPSASASPSRSPQQPSRFMTPIAHLDTLAADRRRKIVISHSSVSFPDLKIGQKEKQFVRIKNCDSVSHRLLFTWPEWPFCVEHESYTLSAKHFTRLPVSVRTRRHAGALNPPCPGTYSALLVVHSPTAHDTVPVTLTVTLTS